MSAALYTLDGDQAVPAELTRGPWDPGAQHGGAPAALIAHLVERLPEPGPMRVARITFELLRPVPIEPMGWAAEVVRPGRRVQLIEAELTFRGEAVLRARALKIRVEEGVAPAVPADAGVRPLPPEQGEGAVASFGVTRPWFGEDGMDIRYVVGSLEEPGPAVAWYRLRVPVVAGQPVTPLQRAAAAADFGNGASAALDWSRYVFINPDLTLYIEREPVGEWICLDARTTVDPGGTGLATSVMRDEQGPFGRGLQALYVAGR